VSLLALDLTPGDMSDRCASRGFGLQKTENLRKLQQIWRLSVQELNTLPRQVASRKSVLTIQLIEIKRVLP
jgi:hypothetical protein